MDTFEMNVDGSIDTVTAAALHYDTDTEITICMVDGLFYVVDCEGDPQARGGVGPTLPSVGMAMALLAFIKMQLELGV